MQKHIESDNVVLLAMELEFSQVVAFVATIPAKIMPIMNPVSSKL